jgi:uncharacterized membrane protein
MFPALSVITVISVVIFLGGSLFGALVLLAVSIHRTRYAPLSQMGRNRHGVISRRLLTTTRRKGWGE